MFSRFILHAIAVLGVKVKPASPVATLCCANLDPSARRWLPCYQDVLLTEPADWPVSSAKRLECQQAASDRRRHPKGRSEDSMGSG
jgi:hypothetical protein